MSRFGVYWQIYETDNSSKTIISLFIKVHRIKLWCICNLRHFSIDSTGHQLK